MRLRPTLSSARLSALALLNVFPGVCPSARASDRSSPDDADAGTRSPHLILGGAVGYVKHWGQAYDVDVVSGASAPAVPGSDFNESGVALNAFADFAALDLGPGNLGVTTGFTWAAPKTFMNIALEPRYRFHFPLANTTLRSIEPWAGLGVAFAFRDRIDKDRYLWIPLSAGCDVAVGSKRLYAGVAVDFNTINPRGVTRTVTSSGERHDYEAHIDNFAVLLRLSYLLF